MITANSHLEPARDQPSPVLLAALAGLVFSTAYGSIWLTYFTGRIAAIWIANAIVLCVMLKRPARQWPQIIAAGCLGNLGADLAIGDSFVTAAVCTLCNVVEILAVAAPLRALKLDRDFVRPNSLLVFYALAVGPATIAASILSAVYFHWASGAGFVSSAASWYASDALGLVIVVPVIMTARLSELRDMFRKGQIAATAMLLAGMGGVLALNFFASRYPFAFMFFPIVVLLTFQRGFAGGTIGLLLSGGYLMADVFYGTHSGGLAHHSLREQMLIVQVFVAVIGFTVVLVGAALAERRRLERGLASAMTRAELSREEAVVAKEAAEKASRTKSMFLANMSHELRTPLNAVIGFAELMGAEMFGPLGDARYRDYTARIQDAGHHLLDLINDVLDMSKIEAGKLELNRERIAMGALVRECVELMSEGAQQGGIVLVADICPGALWADADRRAMKQILLNLLSNAIKFTPAGGRVVAGLRQAQGMAVLWVADTGVGIPADQLYLLGNPFVQLRGDSGASHAGTGLGLALVRALAQMHGGHLRIESVEGTGTTASVEIPVAEVAAVAA
jgi:signal transduction histidine kinase